MKLLPLQQLQDTKARELEREALRTKERNEAADRSLKRLAQSEADFQLMLAGQQARWAREQQDHQKLAAEMTKEVYELEERREKALIPVKIEEEKAQEALRKASETLKSALQREEEAEQLSEALQDKLDAVGAREQDLLQKEKRAEVKEGALKIMEEQRQANAKTMTDQMQSFNVARAELFKDLERRNTELTLKERSLNAWSERLNETEKTLADWDKRLKDERGTLDRILIRKQKGSL